MGRDGMANHGPRHGQPCRARRRRDTQRHAETAAQRNHDAPEAATAATAAAPDTAAAAVTGDSTGQA